MAGRYFSLGLVVMHVGFVLFFFSFTSLILWMKLQQLSFVGALELYTRVVLINFAFIHCQWCCMIIFLL